MHGMFQLGCPNSYDRNFVEAEIPAPLALPKHATMLREPTGRDMANFSPLFVQNRWYFSSDSATGANARGLRSSSAVYNLRPRIRWQ